MALTRSAGSTPPAAQSFFAFPLDGESLLSSLHPGVDPSSFLLSAGLSLDELLKADAAGNALKEPSALNAGLKADPVGNFLKLRPEIDLSRVERPPTHEAFLARAAAADGGASINQPPPPVASAWDPEPNNPDMPHGHVESHVHNHMPASAEEEPVIVDGQRSSDGDSGTAPLGALYAALVILAVRGIARPL